MPHIVSYVIQKGNEALSPQMSFSPIPIRRPIDGQRHLDLCYRHFVIGRYYRQYISANASGHDESASLPVRRGLASRPSWRPDGERLAAIADATGQACRRTPEVISFA